MDDGRIRQSFAWDTFIRGRIDAETLVRGAADIGYEGIDHAPPEHWSMIRDHGLRLVTTAGHALEAQGIAHRFWFHKIEPSIMRALEHAVEWSIPNVVVYAGNRYVEPVLPAEDVAEAAAAHLRLLAPRFEAAGVTILLAMIDSKTPGRYYLADNISWASHVLELTGSPSVKLLYDIYHMQIMQGDLLRTAREHIDDIGHIRTGGVPGRRDLDDQQEINYPAVLKTIATSGYNRWITHEFYPRHAPLDSLRAAFALTQAATQSPVQMTP